MVPGGDPSNDGKVADILKANPELFLPGPQTEPAILLVEPDSRTDYKVQEVTPDPDTDYRILVVAPQTNSVNSYGLQDLLHGQDGVVGRKTVTLTNLHQEDAASVKRAQRILFPVIDFEDAQFEDVVRFLRDHAREIDPDAVGVDIRIEAHDSDVLGPTATKTITAHLRRMSLCHVLQYCADLVGFDVSADAETLVVVNRGE
jgi:hypothetical protein